MGANQSYDSGSEAEYSYKWNVEKNVSKCESSSESSSADEVDDADEDKEVGDLEGNGESVGASEEGSAEESAEESEEETVGNLQQQPELSPFNKHLSPLEPQLPSNFPPLDNFILPEGASVLELYDSSSISRTFNKLSLQREGGPFTFDNYSRNPPISAIGHTHDAKFDSFNQNPSVPTAVEPLIYSGNSAFESDVEELKSTNSLHASLSQSKNPLRLSDGRLHSVTCESFTEIQDLVTEIYLIRHGEASHNALNVIGGRSPSSLLTPHGLNQAKTLGKYLNYFTDIKFDAVYSSPIQRVKATAIAVCKELSISERMICYCDELQELTHGEWEGKSRDEIYTDRIKNIINLNQPDFRAPGGESQRQVEFRMLEFINNNVLHWNSLKIPAQPFSMGISAHKMKGKYSKLMRNQMHRNFSESSLKSLSEIDSDFESYYTKSSIMDDIYNKSTKADGFTSNHHDDDDDNDGHQPHHHHIHHHRHGNGFMHDYDKRIEKQHNSVCRVAIFTHAMAIKCLLRGILNSNPNLTHKISIDNTSITILKHSSLHGWHVVKVNDTSHLLLNRLNF